MNRGQGGVRKGPWACPPHKKLPLQGAGPTGPTPTLQVWRGDRSHPSHRTHLSRGPSPYPGPTYFQAGPPPTSHRLPQKCLSTPSPAHTDPTPAQGPPTCSTLHSFSTQPLKCFMTATLENESNPS